MGLSRGVALHAVDVRGQVTGIETRCLHPCLWGQTPVPHDLLGQLDELGWGDVQGHACDLELVGVEVG